MTFRPHPTLEDWLDWVHERMDDERATKTESHFHACTRCRDDFPMLRELRRAHRFPLWVLPPAEVQARTKRRPDIPRPPVAPEQSRHLQWEPADIRGRTLVGVPEPRTLNAVLRAAEISIVAVPPGDDAFWQIEGRIWLRERPEESAEVLVLQDDHIIVHRTVRDAEFFEIREILPPGWQLEVHLPDQKTLTLSDSEP